MIFQTAFIFCSAIAMSSTVFVREATESIASADAFSLPWTDANPADKDYGQSFSSCVQSGFDWLSYTGTMEVTSNSNNNRRYFGAYFYNSGSRDYSERLKFRWGENEEAYLEYYDNGWRTWRTLFELGGDVNDLHEKKGTTPVIIAFDIKQAGTFGSSVSCDHDIIGFSMVCTNQYTSCTQGMSTHGTFCLYNADGNIRFEGVQIKGGTRLRRPKIMQVANVNLVSPASWNSPPTGVTIGDLTSVEAGKCLVRKADSKTSDAIVEMLVNIKSKDGGVRFFWKGDNYYQLDSKHTGSSGSYYHKLKLSRRYQGVPSVLFEDTISHTSYDASGTTYKVRVGAYTTLPEHVCTAEGVCAQNGSDPQQSSIVYGRVWIDDVLIRTFAESDVAAPEEGSVSALCANDYAAQYSSYKEFMIAIAPQLQSVALQGNTPPPSKSVDLPTNSGNVLELAILNQYDATITLKNGQQELTCTPISPQPKADVHSCTLPLATGAGYQVVIGYGAALYERVENENAVNYVVNYPAPEFETDSLHFYEEGSPVTPGNLEFDIDGEDSAMLLSFTCRYLGDNWAKIQVKSSPQGNADIIYNQIIKQDLSDLAIGLVTIQLKELSGVIAPNEITVVVDGQSSVPSTDTFRGILKVIIPFITGIESIDTNPELLCTQAESSLTDCPTGGKTVIKLSGTNLLETVKISVGSAWCTNVTILGKEDGLNLVSCELPPGVGTRGVSAVLDGVRSPVDGPTISYRKPVILELQGCNTTGWDKAVVGCDRGGNDVIQMRGKELGPAGGKVFVGSQFLTSEQVSGADENGTSTIQVTLGAGFGLNLPFLFLQSQGQLSEKPLSVSFEMCKAGELTNATTGSCSLCPRGQYNLVKGQFQCLKCDPGQYADELGAKKCKDCNPGEFSNSSGAEFCYVCTPGRYSIVTRPTKCALCPLGEYSKLDNSSGCEPCADGYVAETEGTSNCTKCGAGTFEVAHKKCTSCPRGEHSTPDKISCAPCEAGRVAENPGTDGQCNNCTAGKKANSDNTACINCQIGRHSTPDKISCDPCEAGRVAERDGFEQCNNCTGGKKANTDNTECINCEIGKHSTPDKTTCEPCEAGRVAKNPGADGQCEKCTGGTKANTDNTECIECEIGKHSTPDKILCEPCKPGHVAERKGTEICTECKSGTYESKFTECVKCKLGQASAKDAATFCDDCLAGLYANERGLSQCKKCQAGKSSNRTSSKTCEDCLEGRFSLSDGAVACDLCEINSVQPLSGQTGCLLCLPPLAFQPKQGETECLKCPDDTFLAKIPGVNDSLSSFVCKTCPEGGKCKQNRVQAKEGLWLGNDNNGALVAYPCYPKEVCGSCPSCTDGIQNGDESGVDTGGSCESVLAIVGLNSSNSTINSTNSTAVAAATCTNFCRKGHLQSPDNVLCAQCAEGYNSWNGNCVVCEALNGGMLTLMLIAAQVYICIFHGMSQSTKGDTKILVYFTQIAALLVSSRRQAIGAVVDFFNFDMLAASSCLWPMEPSNLFLMGYLTPFMLYCHLNLFFLIMLAVWGVRRKPGEKFHKSPFIRTAFGLGLFAYSSLTATALKSLDCVNVQGKWMLRLLPAVDCARDGGVLLAIAIITIILVTIGAPVFMYVFLYRAEKSDLLGDEKFKSRYAILYETYKPQFWWWEAYSFSRRTLLIAASLASSTDTPSLAPGLMTVLNIIFLVIHIVFQPFHLQLWNQVDTAVLVELTVFSLVLTMFPTSLPIGAQVFIAMLVVVPLVLLSGWVAYGRLSRASVIAGRVKKSLSTFSRNTFSSRTSRGTLNPLSDNSAKDPTNFDGVEMSSISKSAMSHNPVSHVREASSLEPPPVR